MINFYDKDGKVTRSYTASTKDIGHLCFANIQCLLQIALADPDEHIRQMGGEDKLLELALKYLYLAEQIREYEGKYPKSAEVKEKPEVEKEDDDFDFIEYIKELGKEIKK